MIKAGIPLQNVAEKRNVSMFITNIQCKPAGPFSCPMVVSMRPIPRGLVEKAVIVTAAYDAVHGAPIHVGDPSVIGIDDINNTDFGEPSDIGDLIPMFWACGVTSSLAVRSASKKSFVKLRLYTAVFFFLFLLFENIGEQRARTKNKVYNFLISHNFSLALAVHKSPAHYVFYNTC